MRKLDFQLRIRSIQKSSIFTQKECVMQAMEEHGEIHWYSYTTFPADKNFVELEIKTSFKDDRDAARAMRVMMNFQCSQLFIEICASHATQALRVLHTEYHGNMQEGNLDGEEQIVRLLDQCIRMQICAT